MASMAERDAFGRLPDENPLEGLGAFSDDTASKSKASEPAAVASDWSVAPPSSAKAEPAAEAKAATSASSSAPRTGNPAIDRQIAEAMRQAQQMGGGLDVAKSVRNVGRIFKVAVFLVVIGVVASVARPLIDVGKDVRDAVGEIPSSGEIKIPGTGGSDGGEDAVPTGLSSKSMLRRANLEPALKRLGTSGLGRMQTLTIRPDRLDARLLTKGGSLRSVQIRYGGPEINAFGASGAGFSHLETVPFARIDAGAPQRLARSAAGRARLPVSRVDYITLNGGPGGVTWNAYMKSGRGIFSADARGRITRRIS